MENNNLLIQEIISMGDGKIEGITINENSIIKWEFNESAKNEINDIQVSAFNINNFHIQRIELDDEENIKKNIGKYITANKIRVCIEGVQEQNVLDNICKALSKELQNSNEVSTELQISCNINKEQVNVGIYGDFKEVLDNFIMEYPGKLVVEEQGNMLMLCFLDPHMIMSGLEVVNQITGNLADISENMFILILKICAIKQVLKSFNSDSVKK